MVTDKGKIIIGYMPADALKARMESDLWFIVPDISVCLWPLANHQRQEAGLVHE
jgi:hypothetical protein